MNSYNEAESRLREILALAPQEAKERARFLEDALLDELVYLYEAGEDADEEAERVKESLEETCDERVREAEEQAREAANLQREAELERDALLAKMPDPDIVHLNYSGSRENLLKRVIRTEGNVTFARFTKPESKRRVL